MCGIAGIFHAGDRNAVDAAALDRMTDSLAHRGPDGRGVHLAAGLGFGHRRLAIIDRSGGGQPLFNEDGSVCVTYNGEIYNFDTLAQELSARGHRLASRCDTEVIVHAWEEWGPACVEHFRGMFAFALYDSSSDTVFLARDRLGIKPLHYSIQPDRRLLFGSEIKAIRATGGVSDAFDARAIEAYLGLGYIPDPQTFYRDVAKLPPGHTLTWRRGETAPSIAAYWDVSFDPAPADPATASAALRERVTASVREQMVSDVPLGGFLSGGLDSSVVVAAMAGARSSPVTTCTVGFDEAGFDESADAQAVATLFGTDHHNPRVDGGQLTTAETIADVYDEPFADGSALPTLLLCRETRRYVTVALSGDGGDELFAGYRRHRFHMAEEAIRRRLPRSLRRGLLGPLAAIYPQLDWAPRFLRAKATLRGLATDGIDAYAASVAITPEALRRDLYTDRFRDQLDGFRARDVLAAVYAQAGTDDELARIQYTDIKTNLAAGILTKVDRASMAASLEVRVPLLDHDLVAWAARLPQDLKIRDGRGKHILDTAASAWLPAAVRHRPKRGFAAPFAAWLRGPLKQDVTNLVQNGAVLQAGIVERAALERVVRAHMSGRRDHARLLWALLVLEAVLRRTG